MTTILIIEDDESLRESIAEILQFEGFSTLMAFEGRQGFEMAVQHIPDLIICDGMMPVMDGFEVLNKIRQDPTTKLIPLIFISALAERENTRKGMDLGADDYLVKPFTRLELLKTVRSRLTRLHQQEKRQQDVVSDLKMKVLRSLPHELNTPLNGIIGFGQLLKDEALSLTTDEVAAYGTHIHASGLQLYRHIQNYLLLSELEMSDESHFSGVEPWNNAMDICREVAQSIAMKYQRTNDLSFVGADVSIMIAEQEFKKLMEEVIDNAFKFSQPGSAVSVVMHQELGNLRISVTDQGRGMQQSEIEKIGMYEQFKRMVYEQQGLGLGLAIVRKLVTLHHGRFQIKSQPEKQTIVEVILPL